MYIFREKDSKLSIGQLEKHIRRITVEKYILFFIVRSIGCLAFLPGFPTHGFYTIYAKLYIDIPVMTLEFSDGFRRGHSSFIGNNCLQIIAINVIFSNFHSG